MRGLDHVAHFFELSLLKDFAELQVVFVAQDPVVMLLEGERDVLRLLSLNGLILQGFLEDFCVLQLISAHTTCRAQEKVAVFRVTESDPC